MANFKSMLALRVVHQFFSDDVCRSLVFSPTATTRKRLAQYQLMVKASDSELALLADTDFKVDIEKDLVLRFEVYAQDSWFGFYTEELQGRDKPLYYSSKNITADNTSLALLAEEAQEWDEDSPHKKKPGTFKKPIIIVDIPLDEKDFTAAGNNARNLQIKLNTRAIYWKYYFFGELANLELDIHDLSPQSPVGFVPCDEPVAKNGKAFISQSPIVMNSVPKQRFQLKDKTNPGKVLIKRLPNAGLELVSKGRTLSGQQILVAEIYINQ
jgi:hypothetical protein